MFHSKYYLYSDYSSGCDYVNAGDRDNVVNVIAAARARVPAAFDAGCGSPMTVDYTQFCPVARTLDIVGDRWTMLILRDLILEGPRKFQDFQRALPRISPNTLSDRLKTLEQHGIVARRSYADHPPRAEYVVTDKGRELRPLLRALRKWGEKHTRAPAPQRA
jgi:DNA-binding HxlR family transcriptional regulator